MSTDIEEDGVESEARGMGWVPKEEFRGSEDKWVNAQEFVDRGKHVMPLLKKHNERLEGQVQQLTQHLQTMRGELESTKTGLKEQQDFYEQQLVERVKAERTRLKAEKRAAREADDVDREVDIDEQLSLLNTAEKEVKAGGMNGKDVVEPQQPAQPALSPAFLAWDAQNPWFREDPDRRLEARQMGERIAHEVALGRIQPLVDEAFFAELDRRLGASKRPGNAKVEGSRGGATSTTSSGRTYADLPAEAKAVCDQEAKRFVKPNGSWKTQAEYRKHYVEVLERTGYFNN